MDSLISVFLPVSLAVIMFSLGLGLRVQDFKRVFSQPMALLAGFSAQVLVLPAVAYLIVKAFGLTGELAFGVMVLSICPGGVTSNMLTKLAGGTLALSISLTGIISLLSLITVPIFVVFWANALLGVGGLQVDVSQIALAMFAITTVPVIAGMTLRAMAPDRAEAMDAPLSKLATVLFVVIVLGAIAAAWDVFTANLSTLGPILLLMVVALLLVGWTVATLMGLAPRDRAAVAVETGIQNSTLGITLAGLLHAGADVLPVIALPSAMYGIVMYLGAIPAVLMIRASLKGTS